MIRLAALALAASAALHRLGRVAGSTRDERRLSLPDDALVPRPSFRTDHAITIAAPPEQVWPWLTQMGWHRGGWYTPRWVDRLLFPANQPSAQVLDPTLVRSLRPGDTIPDGPPGTAQFAVERADPPELLTLHSTTHVPPAWRDRYDARLDWVWTFRLGRVEQAGTTDRTRLLIRSRGLVRPWWLDLAYRTLVVPADYVMATAMLRGLRERAEPGRLPQVGTKDPAAATPADSTMKGSGPVPGPAGAEGARHVDDEDSRIGGRRGRLLQAERDRRRVRRSRGQPAASAPAADLRAQPARGTGDLPGAQPRGAPG